MSYGRSRTVGPVEAAIHGAVTYFAVGIGLVISSVLGLYTVGDDSVVGQFGDTDEELFVAFSSGFELLLTFSILLAVVFAVYYTALDQDNPAIIPATVAVVAGTVLAGLFLLILMIISEPDLVDISFTDGVIEIIVVTIGSALTAALSGLGLEIV